MILRQYLNEPGNSKAAYKDIDLRLEEMRLPGEIYPKIRLVASTQDATALADPVNEIYSILENKRTYCPPGNIIAKVLSVKEDIIYAPELYAKEGDPVAIFNKEEEYFCLVNKSLKGNITLSKKINIKPGCLIQNLKSNVYKPQDYKGIITMLMENQMPSISFQTFISINEINVQITVPMNFKIPYYDVYVRDESFDKISWDWIPDQFDIPITKDEVIIKTFNGCENIKENEKYYVTVIGKNKKGFDDVVESKPNDIICIS